MPPHFRRRRDRPAASFCPVTRARRRGIGLARRRAAAVPPRTRECLRVRAARVRLLSSRRLSCARAIPCYLSPSARCPPGYRPPMAQTASIGSPALPAASCVLPGSRAAGRLSGNGPASAPLAGDYFQLIRLNGVPADFPRTRELPAGRCAGGVTDRPRLRGTALPERLYSADGQLLHCEALAIPELVSRSGPHSGPRKQGDPRI